MHFLMENAIVDSQQYEVLSLEEIDETKKELAITSSRVEATKRKLASEIKVRDAATSVNRLPSRDGSGKPSSKRSISSLASNDSDGDLNISRKKCDDLTQELGKLERRSQELQTRLLEHTAGILQVTHKGYLEKDAPSHENGDLNGNVNGYGGNAIFGPETNFDDRSFYQTLEAMLDSGVVNGGNSFVQQNESISQVEHKLWDLNRRLRDAITQASAGRPTMLAPPDPDHSSEQGSDAGLQEQVEYLDKGLQRMQQSHAETLQSHSQSSHSIEERLEDLNAQLRGIVIRSSQDTNPQHPLPPEVSGRGADEQMAFLESGLDALEQSVYRLKEESRSNSKSVVLEEKLSNYDSVLEGLWRKIVTGETRDAKDSAPIEKFSLNAFSSKVSSMHNRFAGLQEQKDILGRQIQQQREINSKSDNQRDARLAEVTKELEQSKAALDQGNTALETQLAASHEARDQLLSELKSKQDIISKHESEMQATRQQQDALQQNLGEKAAEADKARKEMQDFEGRMVQLQTELTVARAELDGAYGTRAQRAAEVASHPQLQKEVGEANERNATLTEELAAIKAKHEAAGTNNSDLNQRVQALQKELSETIGEYEVMTKSSIEFEKQRENLENSIDSLRDRCESLETQLSDEKVRCLGIKSPGVAGDRSSNDKGATSTSVLKNEFKKMMRETRAENMKALRVSIIRVPFSCSELTIIAGRARRTPEIRSSIERAEKESDPWKVFPQPEYDGDLSNSSTNQNPPSPLTRQAWITLDNPLRLMNHVVSHLTDRHEKSR